MIHQIHGNPGESSYFQGKFASYGQHQWNIKLYGASEDECEILREYFVGDEAYIKDEFGIKNPGKVFFAGRSGGWLVVDSVLTVSQVAAISEAVEHVKANWKNILIELEG